MDEDDSLDMNLD